MNGETSLDMNLEFKKVTDQHTYIYYTTFLCWFIMRVSQDYYKFSEFFGPTNVGHKISTNFRGELN